MPEPQSQVVALVTENLHRRRIDEDDPIVGDPLNDPAVREIWLARRQVESDLISEVFDGDQPEETIGALVAFAATAVEMWARDFGGDPAILVQRIALGWTQD